ncbi:MAG: hypothetical protein HYX89_07365 [Chloroflexi bacterium]|nr:hypothetical protein [Chloroflexota bacterium]
MLSSTDSEMVIQVCAPTLLACDDSEILDAIVAHEFLHYVRDTIRFYSQATVSADGTVRSEAPDEFTDYLASEEAYSRIDPQLQVGQGPWLSTRLIAAVNRLEHTAVDEQDHIVQWTCEHWLGKGYPVQVMDPDYRFRGPLSLHEGIIDKAIALGLVRRLGEGKH